jgi:hypothetical protein
MYRTLTRYNFSPQKTLQGHEEVIDVALLSVIRRWHLRDGMRIRAENFCDLRARAFSEWNRAVA